MPPLTPLEPARIFQLPDRGRTLVANGLLEGSWAALVKLPHPVTALEFSCSGAFGWQGDAVVSHRRIALCVDIGHARAAHITTTARGCR